VNVEDEQPGGLENRYRVEKLVDPAGKHDRCKFFVLDPEHDVHARDALRQYAIACKHSNPKLAQDIDQWLKEYPVSTLRFEDRPQGEPFWWSKITSHGSHCPARTGPPESCTCLGISGDHTK
jgi:Rad3-related DNA helicase